MKFLASALSITGLLASILGIWGQYRTAMWYTPIPNDYQYNEPLKAAWWWAGIGLLLMTSGFSLLFKIDRKRILLSLAAMSSAGCLLGSILVAYPYDIWAHLMILGNGSREWEYARGNMARVLINSEACGLVAGFLVGLWLIRGNLKKSEGAGALPIE